MPTFDLVVVGCGGGPSEHNLSSYFFKPSHLSWSSGTIALEAGSGFGALTRLLQTDPNLFGTRPEHDGAGTRAYSAAEVLSWIRCYLITHAHMDHINGLVLCAGSLPGGPRRVFAVHQTLQDIENVFSDRLWPNLATWNERDRDMALIYADLYTDGRYQPIQDGVSVRTMPLSHGHDHSGATYDSAAFFIRDNTSTQEFLFFGDVEPDSVASQPRLHDVWSAAAPKIPHTLHTIFIECSYPLGRQDNTLYGHLSPEHLSAELAVLAEEVVNVRRDLAEDDGPPHATRAQRARKRQRRNPVTAGELRSVLQGVRVYIIHCKEDMQLEYDRPMHEIIADQVRSLVDARGLGVEIIAATQGMHIYM